MKRSFNYTGRKRLVDADFDLDLFELEGAPSEFEFALKRDDHEISDHCKIFVEAYRGPKVTRFDMGTWGERAEEGRRQLTEFDPGEPVLFRIKVVDESNEKRRIAAWRDRIRAKAYSQDGKASKSILPVYPCDLGNIGWKLDWEDPTRPVLQVNSKISEARDVTSIVKNDPDFAILVFPDVIRQALTRLLLDDAEDDEERGENEWLQFGVRLAGSEPPSTEEEHDENASERITEWIGEVAQAFGDEMDLVSRYVEFKSVG